MNCAPYCDDRCAAGWAKLMPPPQRDQEGEIRPGGTTHLRERIERKRADNARAKLTKAER
jgi:hypothetical protein